MDMFCVNIVEFCALCTYKRAEICEFAQCIKMGIIGIKTTNSLKKSRKTEGE